MGRLGTQWSVMSRFSFRAVAAVLACLAPVPALAQTAATGGVFQLPPVIVTAQKEPADPQALPVSVTAVPGSVLAGAGVSGIRDAAVFSPNTYFSDFTARKLSNPRFRGVGSSPANPSITTYVDGVPQLNSNASSIDLLDVEQLEFVRGPQSALFGRNTLAGVITVASARPSLTDWSGEISAPLANFSAREIRASVSGPLSPGRVGMSAALRYGQRDGYTRNQVSGSDVDARDAVVSKAQLLFAPSNVWETRVIVSGERARDGDYALSDLGGLRRRPFEVSRDFEGHTNRDIFNTTLQVRRLGSRLNLSSTTGLVRWTTEDSTDLDYTPIPVVRRQNDEESLQFTQELRVASASQSPLQLAPDMPMRWQAGVFVFTQNYDQDAVNQLSPFALSPFIPVAVSQHSPEASLDDAGVGMFGQATVTMAGRVDVTGGARVDHERKSASLRTYFAPAIAPERLVTPEERFTNLSPQVSVALRVDEGRLVYAALARGFKAGGFNAASPAGREAYGEEQTWNLEGGVKTAWIGGRVVANAAVFRIDWDDLQLNVPDPAVPAQFFIANVGGAISKGLELEVRARVLPGVDLLGALGYTHARFSEGSVSSGVNVAGNEVPNTPEYTATLGTRVSRSIASGAEVFGGAEVSLFGSLTYDDLNRGEQEAYSLTSLRAGVRHRRLVVEGWIRNAFDTRYVPVAFAFDPRLAPSGFLGESGAPRTFGFHAGVAF
jgi:iron complex outermembrane receptor protein